MFIRKGIVGGLLLSLILGGIGCGYNQDIKNVWKGTKSFFYENVSVPASIDYDEKGAMSEYREQLALSMVGIDVQLTNLEKVMNNADKPPTNESVEALFRRFPWLSGFTGVKADGTILGQVPSTPLKPLDFTPLLQEDTKQNLRAIRGHVQNTPMGPEVFVAAPLYDAHDFLGIVSVYFDMRELLQFSDSPDELVIVAPQAVLWAGKYNFSTTPLAGITWDSAVLQASSGTVSNANGEFYWSARYLGNLPIIFAVAVEGSFGESHNSRTGPTDNTGFVEPAPVVYEPPKQSEDTASEDAEAKDSSVTAPSPFAPETPNTEVEVQEEPVEPKPKPKPRPRAKPAPVYIPPMPEPTPAPAPVVAPSPIYPDEPDTGSSDATDSTDSTSVDGGTEDATSSETTSTDAATSSESESAPVVAPSPIYPDEPGTDTSDATSSETTSTDAATSTESTSSEESSTTSESTESSSESSSSEQDSENSGRPSPFGPQ